jgi:hypothetical protein
MGVSFPSGAKSFADYPSFCFRISIDSYFSRFELRTSVQMWFAGYNILRGLDVLTRLGYVKDDRLDDAVEVLLRKRQSEGIWVLENSPIGRMQANIEMKGQPSKWITLIALRTLKKLSADS